MLTIAQRLELFYWMQLARTFDERMLSYWKQGRGVGGTFSERGHEAISVGATSVLGRDDVIAPMHRDLGAVLLRGITPRRVFANLLGRETGVTAGRDANLHGIGDLAHGVIGFISHLPHSMPVALGAAMKFAYHHEPRVAMTFIGDGATHSGAVHETLNMAALYDAPLVIVVENNLYAYSTPLCESTKVTDIASRMSAYGMPGIAVDGNDVEAVQEVAREAAERARRGGGPSLIEARTMRMLGHAVHDGAEYVPPTLLEEWTARDPIARYRQRLLGDGAASPGELDAITRRCQAEVEDAIAFAEASPWPDPRTVGDGVYALP